MSIEANCFKINGLESLNIDFRLFRIAGLRREAVEYYGNVQRIIRQLSFQMKAPITTYERDGDTFLVVPKGFADPPSHVTLVGTVAAIRDCQETISLRFAVDTPEFNAIRMRYLQFSFQDPLWNDPRLWQPAAGRPFFFKKPEKNLGSLDLFEGFASRVMPYPEGGFGVVVDLRRKLVFRSPLSATIRRDEINQLKGRSCVYKMGDSWYEVSLSGLSDLRVGEPSIPLNGKPVSLIDYLHTKSPKPVPTAIANLSPDGAAVYYRTNGPEQRSAPASLCHLVEDTHGDGGARHQPETIIEPEERHRQINSIVRRFLHSLQVAGVELSVAERAGRASSRTFTVPRLGFGNGVTLAPAQGSTGYADALREYGRQRLNLLNDQKAGFFEQSVLSRQHFVIPKSIANSSGPQFLDDLRAQVIALYPNGGGYDPEMVVYDDLTGTRDFVSQSRAIKAAMELAGVKPGYALVMVHRYARRARVADQLAAWTVKELNRLFQVTAAVIHTDTVQRSYMSMRRDGQTRYVIKDNERKRAVGYIRNVAINKILLTNGKWPFVLDSALHADVVVGIDVKNSTAAFTLIADGGKIIRFATSPSRQKEQLLKNQVAQYVGDLIRKERRYLKAAPKEIVIHRDGRAWPSEIEGLREACTTLAQEGFIDDGWQLTVLEIAKSAAAPMRLFNVRPPRDGRGFTVENPLVGSWVGTGDEGFVCTTGKPFRIPGTANPLHVKRVHGGMSIENCLDDVFALSCLTWGRPEGAMRLPMSIKLCDRSLYDEAADYNEDEVEFGNDNYVDGAR